MQKKDLEYASLLIRQRKKRLARKSLYEFIRYTWYRTDPFIHGWHIEDICSRVDSAIERYERGQSSFIIMTMPPRHGKSEIMSRMLPAYFLGRRPEDEVMIVSYKLGIAAKFSGDTRDRIISSPKYADVFPHIKLSKKKASIADWYVEGTTGHVQYAGLMGGITGAGYNLGILDDYVSGREDAESDIIRDKTWAEFSQSFYTRRAPVSVTLIPCTRWHVDDVVGRILKHRKDYERESKIELIKYPAMDRKYMEHGSKYLFPARFSEGYYEAQYRFLGQYGAAALLNCNPTTRGGNRFKVGNIKIIRESRLPAGMRWVRCWDLASSKKERSKDDPDYTAGALVAVRTQTDKVSGVEYREVYVKDMRRIQAEAGPRNALILKTADEDGPDVPIGIEAVAGYKDAYTTLRDLLSGTRVVHKITSTADKEVRAAPLEPVVETGNFYVVNGPWVRDFLKEMLEFPSGAHDDQVDAVSSGYYYFNKKAVIH